MHRRLPAVVSGCLLLSTHAALLLPHSIGPLTLAESANDLHPSQPTAVQQNSLRPRVPPYALVNWQIGLIAFQIQIGGAFIGSVALLKLLQAMWRIMSNIIDNCLTTWAGMPPRN